MLANFDGKVALITGSSAGIGAATAILFSSLGAKVAIVGRNREKLDIVAKKCIESSPNKHEPVVIEADFDKDEDIKRTLDETIKVYNQLDILVNNAGQTNKGPFTIKDAVEDYDQVMRTNVRSVVLLTHMARPYLTQVKGNIVNVSSASGMQPWSRTWCYCMSKAALDMFTKTMASEMSPDVRVNSVNPGPVRTDFLRNLEAIGLNPEKVWDGMEDFLPRGQVAKPEEIANTIVYLASDAAKNITGSTILSDGGYLCAPSSVTAFYKQ